MRVIITIVVRVCVRVGLDEFGAILLEFCESASLG